MVKVLFTEKQTFGSLSLYLSMGAIYLAAILMFGYGIYKQIFLQEPWGDKPMSDSGLIITTALVIIILLVSSYLLFGSKLVTTVDRKSLKIVFWPYFRKPKVFESSQIEKFEIRKYKPLKEYGGWGVKTGTKEKGMAYNVTGNIGMQLYLKNGKKVLVGTQRRDAFLRSMNKMMEDN